jgi:hypothetical protein
LTLYRFAATVDAQLSFFSFDKFLYVLYFIIFKFYSNPIKAFHSYCREDVVTANNAKSAQQMETEGDQQQQSDIGDRLDNSDSDLRMSAGDTNPSLAMELDVDPASKFEGGGRLEDDEEMKDGSQLDDDKNTDNQIYIENKGGGGAAATGGE